MYLEKQTRTWQRRYLDHAKAHNDLHQTYWYVNGSRGLFDFPAMYPGEYLPVIPVGDDPEESRHWAELMALVFKSANPSLQFEPYLTHVEALEQTGVAWYEYPNSPVQFDGICSRCGQIIEWTTVAGACCGECSCVIGA